LISVSVLQAFQEFSCPSTKVTRLSSRQRGETSYSYRRSNRGSIWRRCELSNFLRRISKQMFPTNKDNEVYQINIISRQSWIRSEHVSAWFHVTSGQLWSFKLEDAHNRLYARPDHHSPLKDRSHGREIQDMKNFFDWRKSGCPPKKFQCIEDKNWSHRVIFSYWTHHQPYDISEKGSHTWRWSNYSIKDSWSVWFERRRPIGDFQSTGSPIGNRSSPSWMTCSGANDDTSIFTRTRGPLNIKDQADRLAHKDVGPNK
jgi:hypothetical protein